MSTIATKIIQTLAEEIISGTLPPGYKLEEKNLAERFQVSRTPVREALREMGARGLIELIPRRGAMVANIGLAELSDLLEAECELEALCAQLSAQRMSVVEKKQLERIHEQTEALVAGKNEADYLELNRKFHELICVGTHNKTIANMVGGLRDRLSAFRQAQAGTEGRLTVAHDEHGAVVEAILASDGAAAYAAMRNHVARLSTGVMDRLRDAQAGKPAVRSQDEVFPSLGL